MKNILSYFRIIQKKIQIIKKVCFKLKTENNCEFFLKKFRISINYKVFD